MKKVSLFALAVTISATMFAQETQPKLRTPMASTTRFGVRAGANLSNFSMKDQPSSPMVASTNEKTMLNGGVFVNIPLGKVIRFQPEIDYSGQGAKMNGGSGASAFTYEQNLHYINVPLMFQAKSTKGFFVETGPQLGYLVAAAPKNGSGEAASMSTASNKDYFDKFDLAWGAGIGWLSRIGLGINARYNWGITNIIQDNNPSSFPLQGTWKNEVGQISLIYQFGAYK